MRATTTALRAVPIAALLLCAACPPPPCSPPGPTTWADACDPSPNSGPDFTGWTSDEKNAQLGIEGTVYGAKLSWAALSPGIQTQCAPAFQTAWNAAQEADNAFVVAVNAGNAASNSNWSTALADTATAAGALVSLIETIATAGGCTPASPGSATPHVVPATDHAGVAAGLTAVTKPLGQAHTALASVHKQLSKMPSK
jgi:hypothetical protein